MLRCKVNAVGRVDILFFGGEVSGREFFQVPTKGASIFRISYSNY